MKTAHIKTDENTATSSPAKRGDGVGNKLSKAERVRLSRNETVIQTHFATFQKAGEALRDIRDSRLYRETHSTFEQYCRDRWEMSKTQANRLIAAAKVVENIATITSPAVTEQITESVVRPLSGLDPSEQKKAFKQALAAAPAATGVTARLVAQAAHDVAPAKFKKPNLKGRRDGGDFVRRSEILDEIDNWVKTQRRAKVFDKMKPAVIVNSIVSIIKAL